MNDNSTSTGSNSACPVCDASFDPWISSCLSCGAPVGTDVFAPLADRVAPQLEVDSGEIPGQTWIDIPISADEPVKVALFSQYLNEQRVPFEHSRRFISVPTSELERVMEGIGPWAFKPESDDDHRTVDSLNKTLREIGNAVLAAALEPAGGALPERKRLVGPTGIDLR